jgi:hypothetical protein
MDWFRTIQRVPAFLLGAFVCLGFAASEVQAERPACRSCIARPSLQSLGARSGAVSNSTFRSGVIDSRFRSRLREVQGFSNLLTDGQRIFERTLAPSGPTLVEVVRQLFIGRQGELLNSTDPKTRTQVRDLYLKNFNAFQGGAKVAVSRYLAANGAQDAFLGNLRVAIRGGQLPPSVKMIAEKYKNFTPEVVNAAALAFAINLISNSPNPIRITPQDMFPDGTIRMNLAGALSGNGLAGFARLLNDNPYDCNKTGIARVDWLVNRILDPDIYYQVADLSASQEVFTQQVGFIDDKKVQRGSLLLIAGSRTKPETVPGRHPHRILQFQQRLNSRGFEGLPRYCFRSHDFNQDPVSGTEEASRDVFRSGVNFTADGGEWICQRANGFPIYYLSAEGAQARANNAPADIALGGGNRIGVAEKCITCHMNGFHGGRLKNMRRGVEKATPYTDHFGRIAPALGQEFFSSTFRHDGQNREQPVGFGQGQDYPVAARNASLIQDNALKLSGAYLLDPTSIEEGKKNPGIEPSALPVAPDLSEEYRKDLSVERQAQELGTSVERVRQIFGDTLISRNEFANSYCRRKDLVQGGQFAPQQRNLQPAQQAHQAGGAAAAGETSTSRPPAP